jgi:hypothetical protein
MELWHYWSTAGHAHRTTGEELDLPHVHAGLATASYPRDHSPGPCCVAVCMHRQATETNYYLAACNSLSKVYMQGGVIF